MIVVQQVLPGEMGKGSEFGLVCPYHAWTYEYNGKLKFAPGMRETKNFNKSDFRLEPVRCSIFHGFVFVCLSKDAPTLEDNLGAITTPQCPCIALLNSNSSRISLSDMMLGVANARHDGSYTGDLPSKLRPWFGEDGAAKDMVSDLHTCLSSH